MLNRFSTLAAVPAERFDYWHEEICRHIYSSASEPLHRDSFQAGISQAKLGRIQVSRVECGPLTSVRSQSELRKRACDDFIVSLLLKGQGMLEQNGRFSIQDPHDIVIYDVGRPFSYGFSSDYEMIFLTIPRHTMLARVAEAERMVSQLIRGDSALGQLAASTIRSAASLDLQESTAASKIGSSIVEIVAAAVQVELLGGQIAPNRHLSLLNRAKQFIRSNLDDPDLNVDSIASCVFVSTSTLARAFATEGTTVMQWLWEERLKLAHRILVEGSAKNVTEVALTCGFTSFSHFSRRFKAKFGRSPSKTGTFGGSVAIVASSNKTSAIHVDYRS